MTSFPEQLRIVDDTLYAGVQIMLLGRTTDTQSWRDAGPRDDHRVTVLAAIIFALQGSYDSNGINAWFERPRSQLSGKAPVNILKDDWNIDSQGVRAVLTLAQNNLGGPAGPAALH